MFATAAELANLLRQPVITASADLVISLVQADMLDAAEVAAEGDLPATAKGVGLRAAARLYSNPAGLTSDALDDYRRNFGGGYLTADEQSQLSPATNGAGAFTISPYGYRAAALRDQWQASL